MDKETASTSWVDSMVSRADDFNPYPLWHGWVLRESFLAGIEWARANPALGTVVMTERQMEDIAPK